MPYVEVWVDEALQPSDLTDKQVLTQVRDRCEALGGTTDFATQVVRTLHEVDALPINVEPDWAESLRAAFYRHDANAFEALMARVDPAPIPTMPGKPREMHA